MRDGRPRSQAAGVISIFDLPHVKARTLLKSGAPVYLPVNPVEYHGPHLSLHNDSLVSKGLAAELHQRLQKSHDWPFILAADLEIGVEPAPGIGSRYTQYRTASGLIREACRALAELGAERVVFTTFHGNPFHSLALEAGVDVLKKAKVRALAPMNALLQTMLTLDPSSYAGAYTHIADPTLREDMISNLATDFHAGFFETSLALHYAPDSVDRGYADLPPCPKVTPDPALLTASKSARKVGKTILARELEFAAFGKGWQKLDPFPGYTGRPSDAKKESGAFFANKILDVYAPLAESVLAGNADSPPPIMGWLETATFGGLITG
jgi:creatinine amidohydrolase